MHERNNVAEEHQKTLNKTQLKGICQACGNILVPEVSSKSVVKDLSTTRRKKQREMPPSEPHPLEEHVRVECLLCRRVTVTPLQESERQSSAKLTEVTGPAKWSDAAVSGSLLQSDVGETGTEKSASANASSRKRAKARKQGGLQTLLQKSKEKDSMSISAGFDLMDFMKKS